MQSLNRLKRTCHCDNEGIRYPLTILCVPEAANIFNNPRNALEATWNDLHHGGLPCETRTVFFSGCNEGSSPCQLVRGGTLTVKNSMLLGNSSGIVRPSRDDSGCRVTRGHSTKKLVQGLTRRLDPLGRPKETLHK